MRKISDVVIVGGGTAGWMTAASLAHHFRGAGLNITLVDSSEIGTVGVGEATIPTIRRFYSELGLSDQEVIRATNGTCKLGIKFDDWNHLGGSYFHPFGLFGQDIKHVGFQHFWQRMSDDKATGDIAQYSLGTQLALHKKFSIPSPTPPSALSIFDWALHFDATKFAALMKQKAESLGVIHLDKKIERIILDEEDGFIKSLQLKDGTSIGGQLFIDCSGFSGLLIEQALRTGYEDWSEWLKCNSAIAVQSQAVVSPVPYTLSKAQIAGWSWHIPLQNRCGNGLVYCTEYISDDEAVDILRRNVGGEWLTEPKKIEFKAGRRLKAWNKNCVAIGLSSGFIEPLESTSIALIENAILRLKMLFPINGFDQPCIDEYNEMSRLEYEACRDFIILHYKASSRSDSRFWTDCAAMSVPARLDHKLLLYRKRGHLVKYRWEIFQNPSWIAVYHGNKIYPESYDPMVDNYEFDYLKKTFSDMRKSIDEAVSAAPTHKDYLKKIN